jgi:two-component system LytT family response regulator
MELRAIIIDDEQDGINSLRLLIEKYVPELKVIAVSSEPEEGLRFIENYHPDIVFLDVNMPVLNGIELVKKLDFRGFKLIYTTAHREYALAALKLGTTDYLLKPIDLEDLRTAVDRVKNSLKETQGRNELGSELKDLLRQYSKRHRLLLSDKEVTEYCDPDDIVRLEARSNYTYVVFNSKRTMLVSKTLKEFEKQLCDEESSFMRLHQSHIVNLRHCLRYRKDGGGLVEMADGELIPLSTSKKEKFLRWLHIS